MIVELITLICAVIDFIAALKKDGETPETIIQEATKRFQISEAVIRRLLRFIK